VCQPTKSQLLVSLYTTFVKCWRSVTFRNVGRKARDEGKRKKGATALVRNKNRRFQVSVCVTVVVRECMTKSSKTQEVLPTRVNNCNDVVVLCMHFENRKAA
jgi:hypothetical protein